jgi:uncharacterized protein (TIGR00730 family)
MTKFNRKGSVGVFCGFRDSIEPEFGVLAFKVGQFIAQKSMRLVYGGASVGLMGKTADGTLSLGGEVLGVLPHILKDREVAHTGITQLILCDTMPERKKILIDESDIFIILPGGYGTLDELFEMITLFHLYRIHKPILVVDYKNYYTPLINWLEHVHCMGLAEPPAKFMCIARNLEDVQRFLDGV